MVKSMEFFDVKTKKKFKTTKFTVTKVGKRKAIKAKSPSGITAFRFVKKDFKK